MGRGTRTIVTAVCMLIILAILIFLSWPAEAQGGLRRTTPPVFQPNEWAEFDAICATFEHSYLLVDSVEFTFEGSAAAYWWYHEQVKGYPYYLVIGVNGDWAGVITVAMGGLPQVQRQYPYGAWMVSGVPMMVDIPVENTFGVTVVRSKTAGVQEVRAEVFRPRLPWEFQPN